MANETPEEMPRNRRRFRIPMIIAGGMALLIAASAVAFGPGHRKGHHRFSERMIERALDEVDATDAQRDEIFSIVDEIHADRTERRDHAGKSQHREQLVALLSAETIDRDALDDMRLEHVAHLTEMSEQMLASAVRVAEVLTPEQRTVLAEKALERFERHRERRARRHGDPEDRPLE